MPNKEDILYEKILNYKNYDGKSKDYEKIIQLSTSILDLMITNNIEIYDITYSNDSFIRFDLGKNNCHIVFDIYEDKFSIMITNNDNDDYMSYCSNIKDEYFILKFIDNLLTEKNIN